MRLKTKIYAGLLAVTLSAAPLAACGKTEPAPEAAKADDTKWPEAPKDGTPVVLEFVSFEGEGDRRAANMRIFNFSDKPVTALRMTLNYLDASGAELKDFPWGQQGSPSVVEAKAHATKSMGAFLPEGTAKVTADVGEVTFKDGTTWKAPETPEGGAAAPAGGTPPSAPTGDR